MARHIISELYPRAHETVRSILAQQGINLGQNQRPPFVEMADWPEPHAAVMVMVGEANNALAEVLEERRQWYAAFLQLEVEPLRRILTEERIAQEIVARIDVIMQYPRSEEGVDLPWLLLDRRQLGNLGGEETSTVNTGQESNVRGEEASNVNPESNIGGIPPDDDPDVAGYTDESENEGLGDNQGPEDDGLGDNHGPEVATSVQSLVADSDLFTEEALDDMEGDIGREYDRQSETVLGGSQPPPVAPPVEVSTTGRRDGQAQGQGNEVQPSRENTQSQLVRQHNQGPLEYRINENLLTPQNTLGQLLGQNVQGYLIPQNTGQQEPQNNQGQLVRQNNQVQLVPGNNQSRFASPNHFGPLKPSSGNDGLSSSEDES